MPRGIPGSGPNAKGKPKAKALNPSAATLTIISAVRYLSSLHPEDRALVNRMVSQSVDGAAAPAQKPRAKRRTPEEMAQARAAEQKPPAAAPAKKGPAKAPAPKPKPPVKKAATDDLMARKKAKAARLSEGYGEASADTGGS
jgi:hypothetical protein